jgi:site-specific recombinase
MIETILLRHLQQGGDPISLLQQLVATLRPARRRESEHATHTLLALCRVLEQRPELRQMLRRNLLQLLSERKTVSLYVDSGIQPATGFFSEMWRRISRRILPDAIDPQYLKDLFGSVFCESGDEAWVNAVPDQVWLDFFTSLSFEEDGEVGAGSILQGVVDAVQVLSYRISAAGLEPELLRSHPDLEDFTSPFIIQNVETIKYLSQFSGETNGAVHDDGQVLVMLDQCLKVIARVKRQTVQRGTSISLTFLLQRLQQQITRQELLLELLAAVREGSSSRELHPVLLRLLRTLVTAEACKHDVRQYWRENMELVALRVTENASRTGEHYITESRQEYFGLMRSAMGAGVVIALMAMLKLIVAGHHLPPLTEAIVFSLNYGLGFVLIHILHFTVATKQPAMTAAAIAASIDESGGKAREMEGLSSLIAQTMRSQLVAIFGNVALAVPIAMLIALGFSALGGTQFVSPEKSLKLLAEVDPLHSGALFYAAIAGVCLFLSGLIAGYHDNLAVYNNIPQRLRSLSWLRRLLGEARLDRMAAYVENNLGALAGNFYFGCLLGGMAGLGVLLGLPVDIRHIAFSSAFVGFSLIGLEFSVTWQMALLAALGVMLIGVINLLVSFLLALYVAMKSRKVSFLQRRMLLATVAQHLLSRPRDFVLPPRGAVPNENVG